MLDPKILRENPEKIQKMLKDRVVDFDFDGLVKLDKKRREFIIKTDELRKKRNDISLEIGQKKKAGQDSTPSLEMMKTVSKQLEELEIIQNKTESDYTRLALTIPNLIHESVPVSPDETGNQEIRKWGEPPKFDFQIQDHVDFSTSRDLVD